MQRGLRIPLIAMPFLLFGFLPVTLAFLVRKKLYPGHRQLKTPEREPTAPKNRVPGGLPDLRRVCGARTPAVNAAHFPRDFSARIDTLRQPVAFVHARLDRQRREARST